MSTAAADLDMAETIVVNAKMRRTGVCGAAETLLVDRAVAGTHLTPIVEALHEAGCEIRGDEATRARCPGVDAGDRGRLVDRISRRDHRGEASSTASTRRSTISRRYGSHHTEAIVTDDAAAAERFLAEVDSAPSCCTTPRPSSPMAASSAWAPRSASPPARCMRAGRSASSS